MLSATVESRAAVETLRTWPERLRASVREGLAQGADTLLGIVRAKLSGDVLRTRSGALRASLRAEVSEDAGGLTARVWSDGSVPYARIQEYGGRIAIPEIVAENARALAFAYGGKMVFAKRAAAHVVDIPARSYMRSSLQDFAPAFLDAIRRLATDGGR